MSGLVDWLERSGIESMKAHHQSADIIAKESATTLTVLLAGLGASLAYGMKALEGDSWSWLSVGALTATAYLVILAWLLVHKCMSIGELPAIYYEPGKIDPAQYTLEDVQQQYRQYLQRAIDTAAARNAETAGALNRIRTAAVLTPVPFILAALGWKVFGA